MDMQEYLRNRYHRIRAEWIERLGGQCVKCGATERLEFDHIDEQDKSFDLAKWWSSRKADQELEKCQLLCYFCHKEKTIAKISVDHGEGLTGKRNCRCELCGPLKQEYMRQRTGAKPRKFPEHGEYGMYRKGCRCESCRAANTARMKKYRGAE